MPPFCSVWNVAHRWQARLALMAWSHGQVCGQWSLLTDSLVHRKLSQDCYIPHTHHGHIGTWGSHQTQTPQQGVPSCWADKQPLHILDSAQVYRLSCVEQRNMHLSRWPRHFLFSVDPWSSRGISQCHMVFHLRCVRGSRKWLRDPFLAEFSSSWQDSFWPEFLFVFLGQTFSTLLHCLRQMEDSYSMSYLQGQIPPDFSSTAKPWVTTHCFWALVSSSVIVRILLLTEIFYNTSMRTQAFVAVSAELSM